MKFLIWTLVAILIGSPLCAAPATMPWIRAGSLRASAVAVLGEMRDAEKYGLRSRDYGADELLARARTLGTDPVAAATLDADVSRAVVRFVSHLHSGRVDPRLVGHDLDVRQSAIDGPAAIRALSESGRPLDVLADYEPAFHHYHLLRAALANYRVLAAHGDPPPLPSSGRPSVKPGEYYVGMRALRARLVQLGDLESAALTHETGDQLDAVTAMALVRFQARHRLDIDGALGRATIDALNVPLAQRVRQIEFAIERSRWLPPRLASPPIIVNIPHFELFAFRTTEDRESDILVMDVVVGKIFPENNTPVFVADMRQVVLRPYWDVPRSILLAEYLPLMRAKEHWVAANGFEIVRGAGDDGIVVEQDAESIAGLESGALRLRQKRDRATRSATRSSCSRTATTSTCTTRRRRERSRSRGARRVMAACASRTRWRSRGTCYATIPSGPRSASRRR